MIRISVKGSVKNATRAASRRGINAKKCHTGKHGVFCDVPCSQLTKVMHWYAERGSSMKAGRGGAPGKLTFFSQGSCKPNELKGAHRKKRKR